jgi:3-hydroxybutyrate dehydrogenase
MTEYHAVVTGGGRGIGAAIAEALSAQGMRLTLMGRDMERLRQKADSLNAQAIPIDVTQPESVDSAFRDAVEKQGTISILVNNAGSAESASFARTDLALWQRMLDVNLTGAFLCSKQVVPEMMRQQFGRIINIASTAAQKGYPYVTAYCAAKHGVLGLTRALAFELAKTGVTVNAVCPGYTNTDLVTSAVENITQKTSLTAEQALTQLVNSNPQARLIQPEEVANTVVWLCSPASAAITGQAISVSGGEIMM